MLLFLCRFVSIISMVGRKHRHPFSVIARASPGFRWRWGREGLRAEFREFQGVFGSLRKISRLKTEAQELPVLNDRLRCTNCFYCCYSKT